MKAEPLQGRIFESYILTDYSYLGAIITSGIITTSVSSGIFQFAWVDIKTDWKDAHSSLGSIKDDILTKKRQSLLTPDDHSVILDYDRLIEQVQSNSYSVARSLFLLLVFGFAVLQFAFFIGMAKIPNDETTFQFWKITIPDGADPDN